MIQFLLSQIKMLHFIVVVLLLALSSCSNENIVEVDHSFTVLIDAPEEIKEYDKVQFREYSDLNLGFYRGHVWIKLEIKNTESFRTFMFINNDLFNRNYRFYKVDSSNTPKLLAQKDSKVIYDHRSFSDTYPNYKIDLQANEKATFLITTSSDGRTTDVTPRLISLEDYTSVTNRNTVWSVIFLSTIAVLLLLNVYLWKLHKRKTYGYYIFYMLSTLVMYAGFEGHFQHFQFSQLTIDHLIFIAVRIWIIALVLFTANFLEIKKFNPRFFKISMVFLIAILVGNTLYQLIFFKSSIARLHYYENTLSFIFLLLVFAFAFISYRSRKLEFKYYLIPLGIFLTFITIGLIDGHYRILPGTPFVYIKAGTLIEFVGFTYFMSLLLKRKLEKSDNLQQELQLKREELVEKSKKITELNELLQSRTSIEKTDLLNIFTLLESSLKKEKDWELFKQKFAELNPNFLNNLLAKHPELSKSEIRLLTLIKIGYSQKEIAEILNIAPDSVKKARTRVRKTLHLLESDKLSAYLKKL